MGFELRVLPSVPADNQEGRLENILRYAELPDIALVVLGGPQLKTEGRHPFWHRLLRRCPRPLLLVGPRGQQRGIVAASDCSDPAMPVIREAGIVAAALRIVDQEATALHERYMRRMQEDQAAAATGRLTEFD